MWKNISTLFNFVEKFKIWRVTFSRKKKNLEKLTKEHRDTKMSCYFSHLSAETGRGELKESLKLGFLPLHPVETLELL